MALNPTTLTKGFLDLSRQKPVNAAATAKAWARIYDSYARLGQIAGAPGVFTGTEKTRMEAALRVALAIPVGVPPTTAVAWATGLTAYWLLPPVVFPVGPVLVPGIPAVIPVLTALFLNPLNTDQIFAGTLSAVLHTVSLTVVAPGPFTLL